MEGRQRTLNKILGIRSLPRKKKRQDQIAKNLDTVARSMERRTAIAKIPQIELKIELGTATDADVRELSRLKTVLKPRNIRNV